jgi:hypothetical protein
MSILISEVFDILYASLCEPVIKQWHGDNAGCPVELAALLGMIGNETGGGGDHNHKIEAIKKLRDVDRLLGNPRSLAEAKHVVEDAMVLVDDLTKLTHATKVSADAIWCKLK